MTLQTTARAQISDLLDDNQSTVPKYLPLLVLVAFPAFLLTGFGAGFGVWQPIPVYVFLCVALLTLQEHIARNRSLAHRAYALLASVFAVLFSGDVFFAIKQLDVTHAPSTYLILEIALLVAFIADTVARRRTQPHPASASVRFGSWAIDLIGFAILFFAAAFLLDLLGGQTLLHPLGLSIGQPYVLVDLNQLFHIHPADPASTLQGLNLVLGLGAIAAAFGLLTTAGVVLPSSEDNPAYAADIRSFWRITRDSFQRIIASLRLVAGPLVWLIPALCVAMFASHASQYFNASARAPSSLLDLFNPLSVASRGNIALGISTLLLGVIAVAAMVVAIAMLEASTDVIRHVFATYHDAIRAIALTWALFMYSLAALNAAAILLVGHLAIEEG
jgi:hypothetical protein